MEIMRFAHHAHRSAAVGKRNQPYPDIGKFGVDGDGGFITVVQRVGDIVVDMGAIHVALRQPCFDFPAQQTRQQAEITAGIQHEARIQSVFGFVFALNGQRHGHFVGVEIHHRLPEADIRPFFNHFLRENLVEMRTIHLQCNAATVFVLIAEIEMRLAFAIGKDNAVFGLEACHGHGREQIGF